MVFKTGDVVKRFACNVCGADWPEHHLRCPDPECKARFDCRVPFNTLYPPAPANESLVAEAPKRVPVQLLIDGEGLPIALANDGTMWVMQSGWQQLENLPQP